MIFELWLALAAVAFAVTFWPVHYSLAGVVWLAFVVLAGPTVAALLTAGYIGHRGNLVLAGVGALVGVSVAGVGLLALAGNFSPLIHVVRVPSPTGEFEAISALRPTHATVGTVNVVYVVPEGGEPVGSEAVWIYRGEDVSARWTGERELLVHARAADDHRLKNSVRVSGPFGPRIAVTFKIDKP